MSTKRPAAQPPDEDTESLGARVPTSLKVWLMAEGKKSRRGLTGELVIILEKEKAARARA